MGTDRVCIKCGGSWAGPVAFDTLCAHDFDEAPEPRSVDYERIRLLAAPGGARACEYGYVAFGPAHDSGSVPDMEWIEVEHPTREGAIAAWKALAASNEGNFSTTRRSGAQSPSSRSAWPPRTQTSAPCACMAAVDHFLYSSYCTGLVTCT